MVTGYCTGTRDAAIVSASGIYTAMLLKPIVTMELLGVIRDMITRGSHSVHGTRMLLHMGRHQRAPEQPVVCCTEEYNGSAWSETTDLPYSLMMLNQQSAGTQNAANCGGNCDYVQILMLNDMLSLGWFELQPCWYFTEARDNGLVGTMNAFARWWIK